MRTVLKILTTLVGSLLIFVGCVWVLQGLNILPGSVMTGHIIWTFAGVPLALAGAAIVVLVNRRRA